MEHPYELGSHHRPITTDSAQRHSNGSIGD